ncbi:MAG: TlpA family protein disulfide reductase [Tannerella sp.]|jgi:peroxiredoxin|nr:TlpA family protein disulfide reductase [Tannerella sp.]
MKRLLLFFILPVSIFYSCIKDDKDIETENYILAEDSVPVFEISDGENSLKSPGDFLGKKTLLVFFTTTCSDCRRDIPFAEYAHLQLETQGLNVITIGRGETRQTINDYWSELDLSMPYFSDINREVFDLFANQTIPRFYLIDEKGVVKWMCVNDLGYGTFSKEKGDLFNILIKEKLNFK